MRRPEHDPPGPVRPTTIRLFADHCPHAVDLYEWGAPQDRRIFAAGTTAHELLESVALGRGTDEHFDAVTAVLLAEGRRGVDHEPPLVPDAVFEGRRIAERYRDRVGVPSGPYVHPEIGIAFGPEWEPTTYDAPDARFRCRIDLVHVVSEPRPDGLPSLGLVVLDYKTSWQTDEASLDTVQIRAQAVAVWRAAHLFGVEPAFIRSEVVNLRTLQTFSRTIQRHDFDRTLGDWFRDLKQLVDAVHAKPRHARPGFGCLRCPYSLACLPSREWADGLEVAELSPALDALSEDDRTPLLRAVEGRSGPDWPGDIARAYAAATARTARLAEMAKVALSDSGGEHVCITSREDDGPTVVSGAVGYRAVARRSAVEGAASAAWAWFRQDKPIDAITGATVAQFVRSVKWGVSQCAQFSKKHADAPPLIEEKTSRRFGIYSE